MALALAQAADPLENWPQWRGPLLTGEAPKATPPLTWSETNGVRWKVRLPGSGSSTPAIWGNQIFVTTAVPPGDDAKDAGAYQFQLLCLDRKDGKTIWTRTARTETPHEKHHPDHGYASGSPITDGEILLAYFGSRGLHAYDLAGNLKWSKDFGRMKTRNSFGEGTSPALRGDTIIVNWDDETENDFIVALDRKTGKELWRTPRSEDTGWSTPLILSHDGKTQVVVNASKRVRGYDFQDGKPIWECGGQTANAIPTPVADDGTVYVTSGFRGSAVMAIALGHKGELTGTEAIRWSRTRNTPYVPSPLLFAGKLYLVTGNNPVFTCLEARTGNPIFEAEKLEGLSGIYASPVAAAGRIYVLGRNGLCFVLKEGSKLEVLARNQIDDKTDSTLALAGKDLLLRGHRSLYCISEAKASE
jgi:outer membrane protein assembly factor BamB